MPVGLRDRSLWNGPWRHSPSQSSRQSFSTSVRGRPEFATMWAVSLEASSHETHRLVCSGTNEVDSSLAVKPSPASAPTPIQFASFESLSMRLSFWSLSRHAVEVRALVIRILDLQLSWCNAENELDVLFEFSNTCFTCQPPRWVLLQNLPLL
mmetsp:Transcript_35078/g.92112  ORF Transcript_35078/g.92112 Transcript_35078/m.92112 type:complete len:153 (-) Transcript_35078:759-1217(-)